MKSALAFLIGSLLLQSGAFAVSQDSWRDSIDAIKAVGREGEGNAEAAVAWKHLVEMSSEELPILLDAMAGSSSVSANWLRSAIDFIADRELKDGKELPLAKIGEHFLDTKQHANSRQLAFDLSKRVDPSGADSLVPGLLNDPAPGLRRLAVQRLIDEAAALVTQGKSETGRVIYRQALGAAREADQVQGIARALESLGETVDLPHHFGFIMDWMVIGPFDNTNMEGFDTVSMPEIEVDFDAEYDGKEGRVRWMEYSTTDPYGMVDINEVCGALKDVTAYAVAYFHSETTRSAQIRIGCQNAWKVWVNGEPIFGQEEYHRGMRIDQYQMPIQLTDGRNTILVKLCQNNIKEDWASGWEFQLRVCDETGSALHSAGE